MAGEERTHTKGEVDILVSVAEVKALQRSLLAQLSEHKTSDEGHFKRFYAADKQILTLVRQIPGHVSTRQEELKKDILTAARKEFTSVTDFVEHKTMVMTAVKVSAVAGTVMGSILGIVITAVIRHVF